MWHPLSLTLSKEKLQMFPKAVRLNKYIKKMKVRPTEIGFDWLKTLKVWTESNMKTEFTLCSFILFLLMVLSFKNRKWCYVMLHFTQWWIIFLGLHASDLQGSAGIPVHIWVCHSTQVQTQNLDQDMAANEALKLILVITMKGICHTRAAADILTQHSA